MSVIYQLLFIIIIIFILTYTFIPTSISTLEGFQTNANNPNNANNSRLVRIDPLEYYKNYRTRSPIYKETHYVLVVSKTNIKRKIGCTYNFEGLQVGYTNRSGYNIIKAIIDGHRMDPDKVSMTKIEKNLINLDVVHLAVITYPKNKIEQLLEDPYLHIYGFGDMDIHRVRAFYPFVEGISTDIRSLTLKDPTAKVEDTRSTLVMEVKPVILKNNKREDFDDGDTNIDSDEEIEDEGENVDVDENINEEDEDVDEACYGMPDILNKHLCNSPYDHIGNPKKYFSIWDSKCKLNTDCPFYRVNGDERGGCNKTTGICEMPVGVKRLGFMKYKDTEQWKAFKYSNGDYVFPYDTENRLENQKSIVAKR